MTGLSAGHGVYAVSRRHVRHGGGDVSRPGHIPLKLLGFYDGVNITAGLPFIRTSADHGTAFDIAWTGKAKSESMATSIELAMHIAQE